MSRGDDMRDVRRTVILALLLAALPAMSPAADEDNQPSALFNALWQRKALFSHAGFKLMIVEIIEPEDPGKANGRVNLKLKTVADLQDAKGFKPQEVAFTVYLSGSNVKLLDEPGKTQYVAFLREYKAGNTTRWSAMPILQHRSQNDGRVTYSNTYLVAVDGSNEMLPALCRDLLLDGTGVKPQDRFKKMLEYVRSDDALAREFASSFAAVNGWGYSGSTEQADAFARTLLEARDAGVRRRMAGAYGAAGSDLLARDGKLLERLFAVGDEKVLEAALGQGLKHAAGRMDKPESKAGQVLVGLIRAALTKAGPSRGAVLCGMTGWGAKALTFRAEMEAIVAGDKSASVSAAERLTAMAILLDAGADNADRLVLQTVGELPSAVALDYAVRHDLYAAAPALLQAVRAGKLQWTDAHSAALSLLTRRFPGGDFAEFNTWWSDVETSGRATEFVADGFLDKQLLARAEKLIAQLGSNSYLQRRRARDALVKLGQPIRKPLETALASGDAEVAVAAEAVLARIQEDFKDCDLVLAKAVAAERNGQQPLVNPASSPEAEDRKEGK